VVTLVLSRLHYGNAALVGLPAYLVRRLQSVLNAAARLIYCMRSADHITDALACLHWLRVQERIDFKVAVLTYKVLHGSAPRYLGPLVPVVNLPGRRTLRYGGTSCLIVPSVRRSTVGDQAFSVGWTLCLEHSAGGDNDIAVTPYLPSTAKNLALQEIISGRHHVNQNLFKLYN